MHHRYIPQWQPPSVLLVDDDKNMHIIFKTVCECRDMRLHTTMTSEEVFDKLEKVTFSVIFIDMCLGGKVDGFGILQQIKGSDLYNHCPVVSTSAYYTSIMFGRALCSGFDAFLPKPFDVMVLSGMLEEFC